MKRIVGLFVTSLFLSALGGCGAFEDPTPETLWFRMDGSAGAEVELILSKHFVGGTNEIGETLIEVVLSDTVLAALPIDTVFDIEVEKRWFVQVTPLDTVAVSVEVLIDVNDRNLLNKSGDIVDTDPWRFLYMFNQRIAEAVDVVF